MTAKTLPEPCLQESLTRSFTLENRLGLHARPASLLVKRLHQFQCRVRAEAGGETANAKSILGLLSLAAGYGTAMTFSAAGSDASEALQAVAKLFQTNFQEAY